MRRCENCGNKLEKDALYCHECGFKIRQRDNDPHSTAIALGWLGLLFFVPLGFVMGLYLISQDSKRAKKNGWWIFGISFIWGSIWFIIIVPMIYSI